MLAVVCFFTSQPVGVASSFINDIFGKPSSSFTTKIFFIEIGMFLMLSSSLYEQKER
jgi:hypothetical protein